MEILGFSSFRGLVPTFRVDNLENMIKKLTFVAVPTIFFVGLQSLEFADAGPVAYAACVTTCLGATWGAFAPACLMACAPVLTAPTP